MGERLFQRLKPVCIHLVRSPSLASLDELCSILRTVDKDDLQPLQQYVLLPLRIILKADHPYSSEIVRAALETIAVVFQHSEVSNWEVFTDFFVSLSLLVSAGTDKSKVADVSEELKHSTVICLKSLVEASSEDVLLQLYSVDYLPPIGHTISILLSLIEQEQLRQLKIDGMHCLTSLIPDEDSSPKLSDAARQIFCSFLPGICMALCRVIKGDSKQGQNVIKVAITTWTKTVTWIMCDAVPLEDASQEPKTNATLETPASGKDPKLLVVKRTSDWLKDTAKKLNILIGQICLLKTSDSWQVRLALVHFTRDLLLSCKRNLSTSVGSLLSLLVGFLADDWPQVSEASLEVLKEFKQKHLNSDDSQLVEVLEENLHRTMTALPRLMRSTDDDQKLATLNLVQGYLTLLGPKINQFLRTSSHLSRLSMGLLQVLEFDVKDTFLLEQASHSQEDLETSATQGKSPVYKFQTFFDMRILDAIIKICHLLGYYGDLMLLVDHFLELFQQSGNSFKKQASLVLNHILAGTLSMQPSETLGVDTDTKVYHETSVLETAVEMVLEEYLSDVHWSLPTSVNQQTTPYFTSGRLVLPQREAVSVITLQNIQNNTLLMCLLLEGIGNCAMVLGPAFDPFLIRCLYPLLEKMASEKAIIRQTAFHTLQTITGACCYSSIPDLLSRNADYLVDAISSKLRHFDWYQQAPHVLKVTVQQCNEDMLPLLEDTIDEILWSLDSHFAEQASSSFIAVLQSVSSAILRWFPPEKEKEIIVEERNIESFILSSMTSQSNKETRKKEATPIDDIREYFLGYLKNKRLAEGEGLEDISDDEDDGLKEDGEEDFHPDQKKVLPLHVQIVTKILQRSRHLLATYDPRTRLKVLSIIQICVQVLATETDELLPMVHKIWPSLVPRFQDEEPLVVCMACDTLATLSRSCRDFLRQRFSKDVLPKLISVLESSADSSKKTGPAYVHTSAHKLQHAILNLVGPLCQELDIAENELNNLCCACLGYLSCRQPPTLQEACKNAFSCFMTMEPDATWLLLSYVCTTHLPPLPSPEFTVIMFKSHPQGKEFEENVRAILSKQEHRGTNKENSKTGKG